MVIHPPLLVFTLSARVMTCPWCLRAGMAARRLIMTQPLWMLVSEWKSGCRRQVRLSQAASMLSAKHPQTSVRLPACTGAADSSTYVDSGMPGLLHAACVIMQCRCSSL